jgi:malonyl-CoA O-methyltransferase
MGHSRTSVKGAVAAAFGAAADTYNDGADVQREVAAHLAQRIAAIALRPHPCILEIGCGTGFLSRHLAALSPARLVLSDISDAMLGRCRETLGTDSAAEFLVMDGEEPSPAGTGFDLICSSLAFQWFVDLPSALTRLSGLLAPGGHLVFATLAEDSFHEWSEAHAALNLASAVRAYPSVDVLKAMLPPGPGLVEHEHLARGYADGYAFLDALKQIGAHLPEHTRRPLAPGALRRVLRGFERGITVTYHVAYGAWRKD